LVKGVQSSNLSGSDAKILINEIRSILSLPSDDPSLLLSTISKLERVVKAVSELKMFINISMQIPRLEGFISAI